MDFGELELDAPAFWQIKLNLCIAAITQVARKEKLGRLIIISRAREINSVFGEKGIATCKSIGACIVINRHIISLLLLKAES